MPSESYVRLVGSIPERPHMEQAAAKFNKNFVESETRRARLEAAIAPVRQQLAQQAKTEAERALPAIGQMAHGFAAQRLSIPTSKVRVLERITTGSIAVTRVPPYDWPWTWNSTNGDAVADENADQNGGTMSCLENNHDGGGGGAGAAAVGIYFRPPVPGVGILTVSAAPSFGYTWWTLNQFDSSHSDAWIGLYVGAYDLGGTFLAAPIDQQTSLWDESHDFLSSPVQSGSSSGYGLNASTFVNDQEFYEIWVWCGGSAWGDGNHTFWGSWAGSNLGVAVPWIHLEYFGGG